MHTSPPIADTLDVSLRDVLNGLLAETDGRSVWTSSVGAAQHRNQNLHLAPPARSPHRRLHMTLQVLIAHVRERGTQIGRDRRDRGVGIDERSGSDLRPQSIAPCGG